MDFSRLTAYVDSLPSVGVPGCDLVVYQDHRPIYRHMAGFRDAENTRPMRGDETYRRGKEKYLELAFQYWCLNLV
jgi:hypothetical protein